MEIGGNGRDEEKAVLAIGSPDAPKEIEISAAKRIGRGWEIELRLDTAAKAARFEHPTLVATVVKDVSTPRDPAAIDSRMTELTRKRLSGAVAVIDG